MNSKPIQTVGPSGAADGSVHTRRSRNGNGAMDGAPTLESVRHIDNLKKALVEINPRPVGVDGIRKEGFSDPLAYSRWNPAIYNFGPDPIRYLQEAILCWQGYLPDSVRAIEIKGRTVYLGTVANRIIERAIARKLSASADPWLSNSSFGYRPGRSTQTAILSVRKAVRDGLHWALKTDVSKFFDRIDRRILRKAISNFVDDPRLRELLVSAITPCVLGGHVITSGVPQGNILSPALSNIYLNDFDRLVSANYSHFRYADDILVLGRSCEEVSAAKELIERSLRALKLELNPEKTFVRDLHQDSIVFLGYEICGGNLYPPAKAIDTLRQKLAVRGPWERLRLMADFVRRFKLGAVRKSFRRLDRELRPVYPTGWSLTVILDASKSNRNSRLAKERQTRTGTKEARKEAKVTGATEARRER
jgi:hypothetical protein